MHRIAVQTIVACCAAWFADHQSPDNPVAQDTATAQQLRSEAQKTVRIMVDGICASVPTHLECLAAADARGAAIAENTLDRLLQQPSSVEPNVTQRRPVLPNTFMSPGLPPSNLLPPRKVGGLMILQPLAFACAIPAVPAAQKRWMMNRALDIARCADMDERMLELRLERTMSE